MSAIFLAAHRASLHYHQQTLMSSKIQGRSHMCEALTCVCCTSMSREIPTLHEIYTKVGLLGKKGDFRCFSHYYLVNGHFTPKEGGGKTFKKLATWFKVVFKST